MVSASVTHVLLATNLLLLLAALYWTTNAWLRIHHLSHQPPWLSRQCNLISKSLSASRGFWRSNFRVQHFSHTHPSAHATAFRYANPVHNHTYAAAAHFSASFANGKAYPCWLAQEAPPWRVAMLQPHPGPTRSDSDVALMSSLLLAISALSLLLVITSLIKRRSPSHVDLSQLPHTLPAPSQAVRDALSPRQIERICKVKQLNQHDQSTAQMDVCAICLEEDVEIGHVVNLPCDHKYHDACIRAWLLRGGITCPLCCYKLSEAGLVSDDVDQGLAPHAVGQVRHARSSGLASARASAGNSQSFAESSRAEERRREGDGCADVGLD